MDQIALFMYGYEVLYIPSNTLRNTIRCSLEGEFNGVIIIESKERLANKIIPEFFVLTLLYAAYFYD